MTLVKCLECGSEQDFEDAVGYCEQCGHKLHEEFAHITNIVTQLPPIFQRFYGDEAKRKCPKCGARFPDPVKAG